jgi:hypothetical protein
MELIAGDVLFDEDTELEESFEDRKRSFMSMHHVDRPGLVESARRLKGDLQALKELFKPDTPTLRMSRGNHIGAVKIGFGDASGTGFGSSWESKKGISFRWNLGRRHE